MGTVEETYYPERVKVVSPDVREAVERATICAVSGRKISLGLPPYITVFWSDHTGMHVAYVDEWMKLPKSRRDEIIAGATMVSDNIGG